MRACIHVLIILCVYEKSPSIILLSTSPSPFQVFIIGLLAVEKYENFRPVLDTYCDKLFHASTVHSYVAAPTCVHGALISVGFVCLFRVSLSVFLSADIWFQR